LDRDKPVLGINPLKAKPEESDNLPDPDVLAQEVVHLEAASNNSARAQMIWQERKRKTEHEYETRVKTQHG
jgi:hypothetical protein